MDIDNIISTSIMNHGVLHQSTEMNKCLLFLQDKQLSGFIEIGSANGASFHCWASVVSGIKISVDWNFGFGMVVQDNTIPHANESDYPQIQHRNNTWRSNFDDVHTIDGDSRSITTIDKVKDVLDGQLVDWIFVDAWHEYDAAIADYNNYLQFLSPHGYIGFHDIYQSEDMKRFWHETRSKYQSYIEFSDGTGTGILQNNAVLV